MTPASCWKNNNEETFYFFVPGGGLREENYTPYDCRPAHTAFVYAKSKLQKNCFLDGRREKRPNNPTAMYRCFSFPPLEKVLIAPTCPSGSLPSALTLQWGWMNGGARGSRLKLKTPKMVKDSNRTGQVLAVLPCFFTIWWILHVAQILNRGDHGSACDTYTRGPGGVQTSSAKFA
eukprot:1148423-Pelagomonas_calceolata.AAC.5